MENFWYLFAAYSIIFVVIFLYVAFIWRRQRRLDAEIKSLQARLDSLAENASTPIRSRSAR